MDRLSISLTIAFRACRRQQLLVFFRHWQGWCRLANRLRPLTLGRLLLGMISRASTDRNGRFHVSGLLITARFNSSCILFIVQMYAQHHDGSTESETGDLTTCFHFAPPYPVWPETLRWMAHKFYFGVFEFEINQFALISANHSDRYLCRHHLVVIRQTILWYLYRSRIPLAAHQFYFRT